ncbi:unnamed protein product [Lota lota]
MSRYQLCRRCWLHSKQKGTKAPKECAQLTPSESSSLGRPSWGLAAALSPVLPHRGTYRSSERNDNAASAMSPQLP